MVPPGIGLYTHHKYRKSIDSQVPLDNDNNPISGEDPEGGDIDLVTFMRTHDAVPKKNNHWLSLLRHPPMDVRIMRFEPLCLMSCHYIKLNPCSSQAPRNRTGDNQVLFALDDEEGGDDPEIRGRRTD